MIICKYTKLNTAAFIPHLDLMRAFGMALRRRGLQINFSEGFNPHARIFMSQPLPLGANSECEYICFDSLESPKKLMDELNLSLPGGVKILNSAYVEKDPNTANMMYKADYKVSLKDGVLKGVDLSTFLSKDKILLEKKGKEGTMRDVRGMIYDIKNTDDEIYLKLACGNVNLRADKISEFMLNSVNIEAELTITKTEVYNIDGLPLDEVFFKGV